MMLSRVFAYILTHQIAYIKYVQLLNKYTSIKLLKNLLTVNIYPQTNIYISNTYFILTIIM